jgi:Tfp pilus assembly protein PilF
MQTTRIDLHVRRPEDLATLIPIRDALQRRGVEVVLSVDSRDWPNPSQDAVAGPVPCDIRLLVASGGKPPVADEARLAVVEGRIVPPWKNGPVPDDLAKSDLVGVAGPARAAALGSTGGACVIPCGLPSFDRLLSDPVGLRRSTREGLGISDEENAIVLAFSPEPEGSPLSRLGDGLLALAATGATLLIPTRGWPTDRASHLRDLARHVSGVHVSDDLEPEIVLAAADAVIGDLGSLLLEGLALGLPTVLVEDPISASPVPDGEATRARTLEEVLGAIHALLASPTVGASGGPRTPWAHELLWRGASAAETVAEEVLARLSPLPPSQEETPEFPPGALTITPEPNDPVPDLAPSVSTPAATPESEDFFRSLEAQVSFGQPDEAIARLTEFLEGSPSSAGLRLLASFHRRADAPEEAREAAAQAEKLAREDLARALCERARADVDRGRANDARGAFEQARNLDADLCDPWIGIGSLELARQSYAPAEHAFRQALEREPRSSRALAGLGLSLLGEGKAGDALNTLERALDLEPESLPAIFGAVQAAFQTGELDRAEQRVRTCLEMRPGNVDLAFTLAGLCFQRGDKANAREMVERVELFRPDYPGLAELQTKIDT